MSGFVDIHHHILYGMDDGPGTFEEMASMLRAASKDGIEYMIATPHAYPGVSLLNEEKIVSRLLEAQNYCEDNHLNLKIISGAEIMATPLLANVVLDGSVPTIAGTKNVLVEFLPNTRFVDITRYIRLLRRGGYRAILAHIERYRCLRHRTSRVILLRDRYGVLMQLNCSAVVQSRGYFADRYIKTLLSRRLIDFIATDAHDLENRRSRMMDAYDILKKEYGEEYANKLTKRGSSVFE